MVRLTRWVVGLTVVTACLAICATVLGGWQALISRDALKLAEKNAADAAIDTQAALTISNRVAKATEDQVGTTKLALGTSDRIADANERQVDAFSDELRLARLPNVDVVLEQVIPYDFGSGFAVRFRIVNQGAYTIRDAEVYGNSEPYLIDDIDRVWSGLKKIRAFDIVPGEQTAHLQTVLYPPMPFAMWNRLVTRNIAMVHAVRLRFKDASGQIYTINRCIAYNGDIENFRRESCADYRQSQG